MWSEPYLKFYYHIHNYYAISSASPWLAFLIITHLPKFMSNADLHDEVFSDNSHQLPMTFFLMLSWFPLQIYTQPSFVPFCICKFTYLLKFWPSNQWLWHSYGHLQTWTKWWNTWVPKCECALPAAVKWGNALPSCFSSHIVNNSFCSLFMASVFYIFVLLTGDLAT